MKNPKCPICHDHYLRSVYYRTEKRQFRTIKDITYCHIYQTWFVSGAPSLLQRSDTIKINSDTITEVSDTIKMNSDTIIETSDTIKTPKMIEKIRANIKKRKSTK